MKIICNLRDVRDACLSYLRFTRASFETGLDSMISMMNITDYYLSEFKGQIIDVRFEDVLDNPADVLNRLSTFLSLEVSESESQEILRQFDKANIQKKLDEMSQTNADGKSPAAGAGQKSKYQTVQSFDGSSRAFDTTTGFQSNHITSKAEGEWRTYFNDEQKEKLNDLSRQWLLRYGYEV